jgi:hypothetical protein
MCTRTGDAIDRQTCADINQWRHFATDTFFHGGPWWRRRSGRVVYARSRRGRTFKSYNVERTGVHSAHALLPMAVHTFEKVADALYRHTCEWVSMSGRSPPSHRFQTQGVFVHPHTHAWAPRAARVWPDDVWFSAGTRRSSSNTVSRQYQRSRRRRGTFFASTVR